MTSRSHWNNKQQRTYADAQTHQDGDQNQGTQTGHAVRQGCAKGGPFSPEFLINAVSDGALRDQSEYRGKNGTHDGAHRRASGRHRQQELKI